MTTPTLYHYVYSLTPEGVQVSLGTARQEASHA